MKAHPILFSGPMIRALLAGTKTQTRRAMSAEDFRRAGVADSALYVEFVEGRFRYGDNDGMHEGRAPVSRFGKPGDLLWVRETFCTGWEVGDGEFSAIKPIGWSEDFRRRAFYAADGEHKADEPRTVYTPSIHMPRWASRLTLRITDIRVQRLREISGDDAHAEGVEWDALGWKDYQHGDKRRKSSATQSFLTLWDSINGAGSSDANPHVWAITFEVIKANVDAVLAHREAA